MERLEAKIRNGLNNEQVAEKIANGLVNGNIGVRSKSYGQILRSNLLSLFNLVNVILLICIIISGSLKNGLFSLVVLWNFIIGTFQEIKAKKTIEKLSLISSPTASVVRNGSLADIPSRDIVLGEIMKLDPGRQVCCDCEILQGSCQVNESMITGESESVYKKAGDQLLSGSFISQGSVYAEAQHVGKDNYVSRITSAAGNFEKKESVIMHSVKFIVRVVVISIVPLTALFVWNNFFRLDQDFSQAMVKTVAAVSSMIPGGLVLLVSGVLALSIVRLAVHHTLVQDLYSVEHLARVDTLLLDKTGTITKGTLSVDKIISVSSNVREKEALSLLETYAGLTTDANATLEAVREYLAENSALSDAQTIPGGHTDPGNILSDKNPLQKNGVSAEETICAAFSSEKKWGLVYTPAAGSLILGAPDRLLDIENKVPSNSGSGNDISSSVSEYASRGKRVLLFAVSKQRPVFPDAPSDSDGNGSSSAAGKDKAAQSQPDFSEPELPPEIEPVLLIIIDEQIRKEAKETFRFFRDEGVTIKVISGDNPLTVSRIAQEAGLENAQDQIDASGLDEGSIASAASKYTVFGRVNPDQKLQIVKALQKEGHVVAMTGDGANDVLALRAADCSIAMQSGTDAARCASDIVLLDSNFASLPLVVAQGRMSINNLRRSAALYIIKTVYAFIFAIYFVFASSIVYPFENIQVTLIGAVSIGIPSFFLALEPNNDRVEGHFLRHVFKNALPAGILQAAAIIVLLYVLKANYAADAMQLSTAATYLMMIMGIIVVIRTGGRMKLWKAGFVLLLCAVCVGSVLIFPGLFSFVSISSGMWLCILLFSAAFTALYLTVMKILH